MHEQFLLAALEQAKLGRGQCAPNPSVGAVAVQQGKIIAQAWHRGAGTSHAEVLALAQFPPHTPGVSLYITLEPCNHWGRNPPCVDAIIKHGITEVIFGYLDPNPVVAQNNSTAQLQAHDIKVTHCSLPVIDEFYQSYTYWLRTKKPWVTVKMAHTLDGKIAGPQGERIQLSNDLCYEFTHHLRKVSDVILTTAKTINNDDPKMNVRVGEKSAKPVAVIDRQLQMNKKAMIFSTASHCHIYTSKALSEPRPSGSGNLTQRESVYPNSTIHSISTVDEKINLQEVILNLGELGYHDVLVEAGGTLFTSLHQLGLVQRTYLYIVPKLLGKEALSAFHDPKLLDRPHTVSWLPQGDNMVLCFDWKEN